MERYEAYKDSGVEWIGEIPEGWKIQRAKTLFTQRRTKGNAHLVQLAATQDRGMIPQSMLESVVQVAEDADLSQFRTVHKNDYVISLRSFQGGFELSEYEGVCSPAYQVFFGNTLVCVPFFKYLLKADAFISKMNSLTVGIREGKNIQYQDFANTLLAFPPVSEQQAIADYLDAKTTEIDALVADCEREVELLQEYRKAVITEAVTKGLDPNAPMKDSGIEWIGEMPSMWRCIKLGLVSVSTLGRMLDADKQTGGCLAPYLSNRDVQWFHIDDSDLKEMDFPFEMRESYEIHDGDMLVCEGGEVGRSTVWHGPTPAFYFQKAIHRVRFDLSVMNPDFAAYQMFQKAQVTMFREVRKGESTIGHLPGDQLRQLTFVVPPLDEQREIVTYLDSKTAEINSLIDAKQSMADRLREYRRSLISEAVTGKFKVPGI